MHFDAAALCEFLAHWAGGTTLSEVSRLLGYTSRRAHTLVNDGFLRRGRATAVYDSRARRWLSNTSSDSLYGAKSAQEAVSVLHALRVWTRGSEDEFLWPVMTTRAYQRRPAPDTFRTLLGACIRKQVVDVVYLARTRELAVSFSPHTLVEAPYRYHFRGYSTFEFEGQSRYWDLVPSRVVSADIRPALGYVDAQDDAEWHAMDKLHLRLKAGLPDAMRQAIRYEHGLLQDSLEIAEVRRALLHYVRAEYLDRRYEGFEGSAWEVLPAL